MKEMSRSFLQRATLLTIRIRLHQLTNSAADLKLSVRFTIEILIVVYNVTLMFSCMLYCMQALDVTGEVKNVVIELVETSIKFKQKLKDFYIQMCVRNTWWSRIFSQFSHISWIFVIFFNIYYNFEYLLQFCNIYYNFERILKIQKSFRRYDIQKSVKNFIIFVRIGN